MIIKTFSNDETKVAAQLRDVLESTTNKRHYIVPFGVSGLFVSFDDKEKDLVVYASRDVESDVRDLDIARRFDSVADCWEYARVIAKEAGLSEDDIDGDVWEVENE